MLSLGHVIGSGFVAVPESRAAAMKVMCNQLHLRGTVSPYNPPV